MFTKIRTVIKEWLPGLLCLVGILAFILFFGRFITRTYRQSQALYEKVMNVNKNSILLPDSSQVYIIQPQGEQEVIIIGDPNRITIKPKKK